MEWGWCTVSGDGVQFVRVELARELDHISEFNKAYPPAKERLQPNLSNCLDLSPRKESKT